MKCPPDYERIVKEYGGRVTAVRMYDKEYNIYKMWVHFGKIKWSYFFDMDDESVDTDDFHSEIRQAFANKMMEKIDREYIFDCPVKSCKQRFHDQSSLSELIIYLNDNHKWNFVQIADWLDTLDMDLRLI